VGSDLFDAARLDAYNFTIRTAESSGWVPTRAFRLRQFGSPVVRNRTESVIACNWNT